MQRKVLASGKLHDILTGSLQFLSKSRNLSINVVQEGLNSNALVLVDRSGWSLTLSQALKQAKGQESVTK